MLEVRSSEREGDHGGRCHGTLFPSTLALRLRAPLVFGQTKRLTDGIMQSMSSARQSEVKAWEEEFVACEHTLLLEQLASGPIPAEGEPSVSGACGALIGHAYRPRTLRIVRSDVESVALSNMRGVGLWTCAIRRDGRKWACVDALSCNTASDLCQAWDDHAGGGCRCVQRFWR